MKIARRRSVSLLALMRALGLRWPWRMVSVVVAVMQFLTCQVWLLGTLAFSAAPTPQAVAEPVKVETSTPPASTLHEAADATLLAQNTTVNRNVPVDLPVTLPAFSAWPTEAEITAKGGLQEPLVPVGNVKPTATEDKALAAALTAYRTIRGDHPEDVSALTGFLASYPASPWRAALLTNLGLIYRQTGYFSRALDTWEEAWTLASSAKQDAATAALADRTLSELAEFNSPGPSGPAQNPSLPSRAAPSQGFSRQPHRRSQNRAVVDAKPSGCVLQVRTLRATANPELSGCLEP